MADNGEVFDHQYPGSVFGGASGAESSSSDDIGSLYNYDNYDLNNDDSCTCFVFASNRNHYYNFVDNINLYDCGFGGSSVYVVV
jgi:hypothetical protein